MKEPAVNVMGSKGVQQPYPLDNVDFAMLVKIVGNPSRSEEVLRMVREMFVESEIVLLTRLRKLRDAGYLKEDDRRVLYISPAGDERLRKHAAESQTLLDMLDRARRERNAA